MRSFGLLADGLGMGLAVADAFGMARYANVTFFKILGAPEGAVTLNKPLVSYLSSSSQREFEKALARDGRQPVYGQFEVLSSDGRVRTFRISLSSFEGALGDRDVWILAQDVTELTEANKSLHASENSLHALSARLLQSRDLERRSMARDLHDITGQELAVIMMSLSQLSNGLERPEFDAHAAIADVSALVRKIEGEIRTLSYVLHPPLLDDLGLASALGWYVDGFAKRSEIAVRLDLPPALPRLSKEKEIAIFRVVQESLTNVLRHSGSASARIRADADEKILRLYVEDSGRGFSVPSLAARKDRNTKFGVGVLSMRERLQQLGGTLEIESSSSGTRVNVEMPLKISDEEVSAGGLTGEIAYPADMPSQPLDNLEPNSRRRILIADDHELMRRGIQTLLATEADLEVCGEAVDGFEAILKTRQLRPDLVIMDLTMPRVGGFAATSEIRKRYPSTKVLVFTNHTDQNVRSLVANMGCHGYVAKDHAGTDLIRAIRAVLGGDNFYDSEIVKARTT